MTDLEITRLCAKAMGYLDTGGASCPVPPGHPPISVIKRRIPLNWMDERGDIERFLYDPLNDDAQTLALVKKFDIGTWKEDGKWSAMWGEQYEDGASVAGAENEDLNRAICECVAKMQAGK